MVLRCLRAELMKCRRAPVWLAFLVLPLFPAVLGTFNYLGNLEVLDAGWYSLWTQHTLFASMFFLPAQFGVFCAWQWRLEHTDHNWNQAMTAPAPRQGPVPGQAHPGGGGVFSGPGGHRSALCDLRQTGRAHRPDSAGAARLAVLRGPGRRGGVRFAALSVPGHPGLCHPGGHRPGGGHRRADAHLSGGLGTPFPTPCCVWGCGPITPRWCWIWDRFYWGAGLMFWCSLPCPSGT